MQLHISPSLRHVTFSPVKGVRDSIKVKFLSRRVSYRMVFYGLLIATFILRFVFVLTAMDTIEGQMECSSLGCIGKRLGPRLLGRRPEPTKVLEEINGILEKGNIQKMLGGEEPPQSLEEFISEMKGLKLDTKTFSLRLKSMVNHLEHKARAAKIQEYLYRHIASNAIPKQLHCLALRLAHEHSVNAAARRPLPDPERVPSLVDPSYHHYVLASDNVLGASTVVASLASNALRPDRVVVHVITDRKTHAPMHAWFALHPPGEAAVEVKPLHHFEWLARGRVPVMEAMERDEGVRSQGFRGGSAAEIIVPADERAVVVAAKLQALGPKYNSVMNHIRIHLPEVGRSDALHLFPSLNKVVFLDDDVVVQADLSSMWDIDLHGKVNGAVETCRGGDKFVMSKRLRSYLNFSHPLILENFDPDECAWAYGMNVFDLEAWKRTNISQTYHHWLHMNLESQLSLWQLGTLPPALIAFHGQVHVIDPYWHMLGLGYQDNTSVSDAEQAAVVHFNGRGKPWLDIAFPQLKPLWTKYVNYSDRFIKRCNIKAS
ncbi:putative galacturonosyltransferase 12 [Acorus calamus]|uniref:Hexosyltransferase n=1 Tax=Acorus calamus TaxID=4465 RepID=A0AAV9E549_ACOCL|nr:putative galacturonosyltransferase 12 [Acorus calamus]